MHNMKILSIIPARGGSTELHMKNIALVNKKPLLSYTTDASLGSLLVNRTIVSTDSNQIAKIAKQLGVEVIKRPKKLSGNRISIEPTLIHVLKILERKEQYIPDIVIMLQPTSPLRTSKHIDEALRFFKKGKYDSVLSGFLSHYFLWQMNNRCVFPINYNPLKRPNRQKMKNQFIENGAIYITKSTLLKKNNSRISGRIGLYVMPEELSFQIDSENDLHIVEQILKKHK